jgi:hypothetical protein
MGYVKGDQIKLWAFGGKQIVRRFVEERGGSVLICSQEEYDLALREGREPLCIGFPSEDVIENKKHRGRGRQPSRRSRNLSSGSSGD